MCSVDASRDPLTGDAVNMERRNWPARVDQNESRRGEITKKASSIAIFAFHRVEHDDHL